MNVANIYRKLKSILDDSNKALINIGLNKVNSLTEIFKEIKQFGEINNLPYYLRKEILNISEDDLAGLTTISSNLFNHYRLFSSIKIPDSVVTIGNEAFRICKNLTSITIPDSVTTIGDLAFYSCDSLTSITIPDSVTSIGYEAFHNCDNLTSITIPNSITSIGEGVFRNCGLTSITIPDSVTSIGDLAFYSCDRLKNVTIPNSVTSIGQNAFYSISNINLYLYAETPPLIGSNILLPSAIIHIPIGSGNLYKSSTNWSLYASQMVEDIEIENIN